MSGERVGEIREIRNGVYKTKINPPTSEDCVIGKMHYIHVGAKREKIFYEASESLSNSCCKKYSGKK